MRDDAPIFDQVADAARRVDVVASTLGPPRDVRWLVDLAGLVGCTRDSLVLDAGGYAGDWAALLSERYDCQTVTCDIAPTAVEQAARASRLGVVGDVAAVPLGDHRFDLVWCRDMLSMVERPRQALTEFRRVLKPRGGLVLYAAFPTPRLEPLERDELFNDLATPAWWGEGADAVRAILNELGFNVVEESRTSPEHTQANLAARGALVNDWVRLAELERDPERFTQQVGEVWYRRFRAWNRWSIYLLLGKLETIAWALRSPGGSSH